MPAPHAFYSKMLAERTASLNVFVLFYFILFDFILFTEIKVKAVAVQDPAPLPPPSPLHGVPLKQP